MVFSPFCRRQYGEGGGEGGIIGGMAVLMGKGEGGGGKKKPWGGQKVDSLALHDTRQRRDGISQTRRPSFIKAGQKALRG